MASLLGEVLFEVDGQGPAPSKDFYQLIITQKEVYYYLLQMKCIGIITINK